jgi:hypothetical protein
MKTKHLVQVVGVVICGMLFACSAHSAVLRVPQDFPDIVSAVASAVDGDEICVAAGTHSAANTIFITGKRLSILGEIQSDGTPATIISGNATHRVFDISAQANVRVVNCVVRDGLAPEGGGIRSFNAELTLDHCHLLDNVARNESGTSQGGALQIDGGIANLTSCRISRNSSTSSSSGGSGYGLPGFGGAIYCRGASLRVSDCTFESNFVFVRNVCAGGALYCTSGINSTVTSLTIRNCRFSGNYVQGNGMYSDAVGGAASFDGISPTSSISGCQFDSNSAFGNQNGGLGGALAIWAASSVVVDHCRFESNRSSRQGGAVFAGGSPQVADCEFVSNSTNGPSYQGGGGALASNGAVAVARCRFFGNSGGYYGGAILLDGGGGAVLNSQCMGNIAGSGGGIAAYGSFTIAGCWISANQATSGYWADGGGGIYLRNATGNIVDTATCANVDPSGTQIRLYQSVVTMTRVCQLESCAVCDSDGDQVPNLSDNCPDTINPDQADCDGNGIGDACQSGFSDCNADGIPDYCSSGDCNSDGIRDACEVAAGAPDINHNGIPDYCECIADLYVDGVVNGVDLGALLAYWGPTTSSTASQRTDLNRDGAVDGIDLGYLLSRWGPCTN